MGERRSISTQVIMPATVIVEFEAVVEFEEKDGKRIISAIHDIKSSKPVGFYTPPEIEEYGVELEQLDQDDIDELFDDSTKCDDHE